MTRARRTAPRHSVTVEIAGEKHVLRSDAPAEYTKAVAAHVDTTIRALPGSGTLEPFRAATLAALSITDELFHAREEIVRLREEIAAAPGPSPACWKRRAPTIPPSAPAPPARADHPLAGTMEQTVSHRATEPQREKKKGFSVAFSTLCGSV